MKYKVTRVELIDSILNKSVVNRVQDLTDDIEVYRKELKEAHRCKRVLLVYEELQKSAGVISPTTLISTKLIAIRNSKYIKSLCLWQVKQ